MSVSQMLGGASGTAYSYTCPSGSYAKQFSGTYNKWMKNIGMTCSDGTSFGPAGVVGVNPWSTSSPSGFSGYTNARTGNSVDGFTLLSDIGTALNPVGGTGGGAVPDWRCPDGARISGISGNVGQYDLTTRFTCGQPSTKVMPTDTKYSDNSSTAVNTSSGTSSNTLSGSSGNTSSNTSSGSSNTSSGSSGNTSSNTSSSGTAPKPISVWVWVGLAVFILLIIIAIIVAVVLSSGKKTNEPESS